MHLTQKDQKLDIVLRNLGATDSTFEVSAKNALNKNSSILRKTKTVLSIAACFSSSHVILWKDLAFLGACFVSFSY